MLFQPKARSGQAERPTESNENEEFVLHTSTGLHLNKHTLNRNANALALALAQAQTNIKASKFGKIC